MTGPSVFLVLAWCGGIFFGDHVLLSRTAAVFAAVLFLFAAIGCRRRRRTALVFLGALLFVCGSVRLDYSDGQYAALSHGLVGERIAATGVVEEKKASYVTDRGKNTRYLFRLHTVRRPGGAEENAAGALWLTLHGETDYAAGTALTVQTKVKALEYYKNFGLYDSRHRDRRLAVIGSAYGEEKDVSAVAATAGWQAQLRRIRDGLTERFAAFLTAQEACVLASLLFGGHYEELAPELVESFAVTGLIHILSVSGSHVVLLFAVIRILGGAAGLRPLPQFAVAALAVFVYSALAEFTGPVVRAALMGSLCALSTVVKREYGGIHSLSLAVFVMTLADPYLLFDLSFRLSCGAAAGIILFRPRLLPFCRFLPSAAAAALAVCLSAQILLVPLLLAEFSSLPVYSFLANVTVGTVLDAVIVLGLLAAAAAYVLPVAATPLLWLIKILLNAAVGANYVIASLPGSRLWHGALPWFAVVAYYLFVAALLAAPYRKRLLLAGGVLLFSFSLAAWAAQGERTICVFDVGSDRATCRVDAEGNAALWYNRSRWSSPVRSQAVLAPALRHAGVFQLRELHVGGFEAERTAAQLGRAFACQAERIHIRTELTAPLRLTESKTPYYLCASAAAVPEMAALLEIRSCGGGDGLPAAAALIVSAAPEEERRCAAWRRAAARAGIPFFSPAVDGEIIAEEKAGIWKIRTYGGETF